MCNNQILKVLKWTILNLHCTFTPITLIVYWWPNINITPDPVVIHCKRFVLVLQYCPILMLYLLYKLWRSHWMVFEYKYKIPTQRFYDTKLDLMNINTDNNSENLYTSITTSNRSRESGAWYIDVIYTPTFMVLTISHTANCLLLILFIPHVNILPVSINTDFDDLLPSWPSPSCKQVKQKSVVWVSDCCLMSTLSFFSYIMAVYK